MFLLGLYIFANFILRPLRKVYLLYGPIGSSYKTKQIKKLYETKSEFTHIGLIDNFIGSNIVYTTPGFKFKHTPEQIAKGLTSMYDNGSDERDSGDDGFNKHEHIALMKDIWNYDLEVIKTVAEIVLSYLIDMIFQSTFHPTISMIYQTFLIIYIIMKANKMLNFPHIIVINGKNLNSSETIGKANTST